MIGKYSIDRWLKAVEHSWRWSVSWMMEKDQQARIPREDPVE